MYNIFIYINIYTYTAYTRVYVCVRMSGCVYTYTHIRIFLTSLFLTKHFKLCQKCKQVQELKTEK